MLFLGLAALALVLAACAGNVNPPPGASFSGAIDVGEKASSGAISFKVSEDGASITDLDITLRELKCDGLSAGRVHDYLGDMQISITDGKFSASIPAMGREVENYKLDTPPSAFPTVASLDNVGQIDGKFSSSTQASGTIKIHMWVVMTDRACELGTFPWKAEAP
jgi:hypothetical protein